MRPVRLEMNGFASFRGETTVDFDRADYFALVGPTGSGKSTVIDAMVFALFGSAPRWGRTNAVQYALAPTTSRATVRLVFDVGSERYRVAREVRRTGRTIQQKMATLERLDDPASLSATTDQVEVLASEVRDVTPEVEKLLGLSFDDFTKAVVLPQGRFAEFLNATVGERQDILLKLLGAHQYDLVMRAAGSRRSAAHSEVIAAQARIDELGGASEQAFDEAGDRLAELHALVERTADLQLGLEAHRRTAESAAEALGRATEQVTRLRAVRIPAGLTELAERSAGVRAEVERLRGAASAAEAAYGAARVALEAGGNRSRLERLSDQWAELNRLTVGLPGLEDGVQRASAAADASGVVKVAAETAWSDAVAARAAAERRAETASAARNAVEDRRRVIAGLAAPAGLDGFSQRLAAVGAEVEFASGRVAEAEVAEDEARVALREAGDAVELSATVARCDPALRLAARITELAAGMGAVDLESARALAAGAERELVAARTLASEATTRATAAGLRAGLEVGHECPVCTGTVATLPAPIDDSDSTDAEERLRQAERAAQSARRALTLAEADAANRAQVLDDARAQLTELIPDGADPSALRAEAIARLEVVKRAEGAVTAAEASRLSARKALEAARLEASNLEAERREALTALREARAQVLALGAPVAEADSLQESWAELLAWRDNALCNIDAAEHQAVVAEHTAAVSALEAAGSALAEAVAARTVAVGSDEGSRAVLLGAEAALAGARSRIAELGRSLDGRPTAVEVSDALETLDALESAEREALTAFQEAGRERDGAVEAERVLRSELAAADRLLRETREPLVPLGAPAVDDSDLPGAWATLAAWAREAIGSAEEKLLAAEAATAGATHAVETAERELVDTAAAAGVNADSAAEVGVAVATEAARAKDRVERIRQDLDRVAALTGEKADAEQRSQVAGMLADHLSAKKFQRWLAGAALDVLVEAASSSLLELSGGQFTLTHDKGEFYVIDHADAEASRSVRTLSGGETFQASLALALALSAELSSMSSNAARLDSIFLDEGFGSLDPDSLEVVATTLERLAQGDRLVGVVTHVQGLAERIPTRFVVSRNSRTSTVTREG